MMIVSYLPINEAGIGNCQFGACAAESTTSSSLPWSVLVWLRTTSHTAPSLPLELHAQLHFDAACPALGIWHLVHCSSWHCCRRSALAYLRSCARQCVSAALWLQLLRLATLEAAVVPRLAALGPAPCQCIMPAAVRPFSQRVLAPGRVTGLPG